MRAIRLVLGLSITTLLASGCGNASLPTEAAELRELPVAEPLTAVIIGPSVVDTKGVYVWHVRSSGGEAEHTFDWQAEWLGSGQRLSVGGPASLRLAVAPGYGDVRITATVRSGDRFLREQMIVRVHPVGGER